MAITDAEIADLASRGYVAVLSKTVTLTDAQIRNIPPNRFEIVPAPGASKLALVVGGMAILNQEAGAYTFPVDSEAGWQLGWDVVPDYASDVIFRSTNLSVAGTYAAQIRGGFGQAGDNDMAGFSVSRILGIANIANQPIVLFDNDNDGGSAYTDGNAANTLKVTVLYTIVNI